ncbi:mechanosensitive ion channel family protein [Corynebacterium aquilae]|uniref:mechanosensitive ion channel family protein n=1 Tax=Corynebacterium aquilae TaxID=203263 RepID=UPI000950D0AD|nr:mechanosensitive ion channel family protein [Corynebacterium aquilae]
MTARYLIHSLSGAIPLGYLLDQLRNWLIYPGIPLAMITVCALLVPRLGRIAITIFQSRLDDNIQESKSKLAIFGTLVYITQMVAYFLLIVAFLKTLGFSLVGAAIPATVISAAVGLGAQSVIADFLAGFFVLQEKQFGVGDWVQFKGNGVDVEGDVIQMTMRATRVRTLNGETVLVPNSAARVLVNHSNYWSRAVAVVPIPLLSSGSIDEAIERSTNAALRAISREDIAPDIRGELDVHPAVSIDKPTVVGMPWLVQMRFVVQVNPARQWAVERAIRTEMLDEFWADYGSATTVSGAVRRGMVDAEKTQVTTRTYDRQPRIDVPLTGDDTLDTVLMDTPPPAPTSQGPTTAATTARPTTSGEEPSRSDVSVSDPIGPDTDGHSNGPKRLIKDPRTSKIPGAKYLSFGYRIRPSTTLLLVGLLALMVLQGLTMDTGEGNPNGAWAPKKATLTTTPQPSEEPAPTPTEEPAQPTPTQSTPPTNASTVPTPIQQPDTADAEQTPADTAEPNGAAPEDQPTSTAPAAPPVAPNDAPGPAENPQPDNAPAPAAPAPDPSAENTPAQP